VCDLIPYPRAVVDAEGLRRSGHGQQVHFDLADSHPLQEQRLPVGIW